MPVSTDSRPSCTHCQEGGQSEGERLVWRIHLDQDLVDTLVGIYPEWFNVKPQAGPMAAEAGQPGAPPAPPPPPLSPPKAEVDDSPLQKSMDKNKESLKVKLMLRRPINQLVAQGIMPPLKTPPAFHEQRQKLERAKMGDLLKAKIQQRPDRQELVRQHILEDVGHVDPSLAERQRMLKKCRLADALNDQLSHRPGPLELIKKNILHTDEPIERAVKEGHIEFKATCEGQKTKPQPPDHYVTLDDDSLSSEATSPLDLLSSPPHDSQSLLLETHDLLPDTQDLLTEATGLLNTELLTQCTPSALPESRDILQDALSGSRDVLETAATQAGIVTVVVTPGTLLATTVPSPSLSLPSSLSPLSSISSPPSSTSRSTPQSFSVGKDKNRKKTKTKTQPKTRTIKFHEYKGPPNAHKTSPLSASPVETSYELLLQQQQLFLQWQLEWQHKYPQIILPASQKPPDQTSSLITVTTAPPPPPPPPTQPPPPPPPPVPDTRPLRNLEDMKVSDLKAELKKRNLPVSGAKPQLIERLKPFSESAANSSNNIIPMSEDSLLSVCQVSPPSQVLSIQSGGSVCDPDSPPALPQPPTPTPIQSPGSPASSVAMETEFSEEIIREQRRKIDQLQRQLLRSQIQLQQQQQQQTTFQPQQSLNAKANLAAFLQQQQLNQLLLQQSQHQQMLSIGNNNHINNNNNNKLQQQQQTKTNGVISPQQQHPALVLNHINLKGNQNLRTTSLPNFLGTFVQTAPNIINNESPKTEPQQVCELMEEKPLPSPSSHPPLPPPLYHDATKLLRTKQDDDDLKGVKSQIVDDVLDILIKNGELPPSAAQDPYPVNLDLRELGLDMESLDTNGVESMDLGDNIGTEELMDIDTVWLDSLMEPPLPNGAPSTSHDPLLPQDPFDFFNIDDNDFKMVADFGWDRVDFAT